MNHGCEQLGESCELEEHRYNINVGIAGMYTYIPPQILLLEIH